MAPNERAQASQLEFETFSINSNLKKDIRPSMIYSILPAVVQNRIPALPSIRRSIVDLRGRAVHVKSASTSSEMSAPATPPPSYTSRPASGIIAPNRESAASSDTEELEIRDDIFERPESSRSSLPPPFPLSEIETGINWKYANQGMI